MMDKYSVPHKVNRHVFKAVRTLCDEDCDKVVHLRDVINEAKHSMRNLCRVQYIDLKIWESLCNLSANKLLRQHGAKTFSLPCLGIRCIKSKRAIQHFVENEESKRHFVEEGCKNTKNSADEANEAEALPSADGVEDLNGDEVNETQALPGANGVEDLNGDEVNETQALPGADGVEDLNGDEVNETQALPGADGVEDLNGDEVNETQALPGADGVEDLNGDEVNETQALPGADGVEDLNGDEVNEA